MTHVRLSGSAASGKQYDFESLYRVEMSTFKMLKLFVRSVYGSIVKVHICLPTRAYKTIESCWDLECSGHRECAHKETMLTEGRVDEIPFEEKGFKSLKTGIYNEGQAARMCYISNVRPFLKVVYTL